MLGSRLKFVLCNHGNTFHDYFLRLIDQGNTFIVEAFHENKKSILIYSSRRISFNYRVEIFRNSRKLYLKLGKRILGEREFTSK